MKAEFEIYVHFVIFLSTDIFELEIYKMFITGKSVFGFARRLALLKIEQFLVGRTGTEILTSFLRTYGRASRQLSVCC